VRRITAAMRALRPSPNSTMQSSKASPIQRCGGRLIEVAQDIFPREQQTPKALGAYQKAEIEKW
jgi:hypothetical protein